MEYKKISSYGSINIPVRMRRSLGIEPKDPMTVEEKGGQIIVTPYVPRCQFCGTTENIGMIGGKGICLDCARKAYEKLAGGAM